MEQCWIFSSHCSLQCHVIHQKSFQSDLELKKHLIILILKTVVLLNTFVEMFFFYQDFLMNPKFLKLNLFDNLLSLLISLMHPCWIKVLIYIKMYIYKSHWPQMFEHLKCLFYMFGSCLKKWITYIHVWWCGTSEDVVLVVLVSLSSHFNKTCESFSHHKLMHQIFIILQEKHKQQKLNVFTE